MEDILIGGLAVLATSSYLVWLLVRNPIKRRWKRAKQTRFKPPAASAAQDSIG